MPSRLLSSLVALTFSWGAFAQDAGVAPPPPRPAAAPAPAPDADREEAAAVARGFFQALLQADARAAAHRSVAPFFLEAQRIESEDLVAQELIKHLRAKRTDLLTLYGVELFTLAEMEQKHGKLPARLSSWPTRERGAWFAVANISGRAAVAMLKRSGDHWRVFAYHD